MTPSLYSQAPMTLVFTPMVTSPSVFTPVAERPENCSVIPKLPRSWTVQVPVYRRQTITAWCCESSAA